MSSDVFPKNCTSIHEYYTSILYSIRYASVVINPHAAHQFLWCPASKDRTFGKSKTRDGLIAMPNSCRKKCVECPGSVPGIEDSTKLLYRLKLNHIRCYTTPPWQTYWSKTHWKDLMVAFNLQRQQKAGSEKCDFVQEVRFFMNEGQDCPYQLPWRGYPLPVHRHPPQVCRMVSCYEFLFRPAPPQ